MKTFFEGKLKVVANKTFQDQDGVEVEYNELYFQGETDEGKLDVLKINTKQKDLEKYIDESGVVEIDVDVTGRNKPKFVNFRVNK